MKLIITVDTEADNQWDHGGELTVENLKYIPAFQEICDAFQVRPTYLVTSEVCSDEFAVDYFKGLIQQNKAEIGAHLHPWTTPPFLDKPGFRFNDKHHAFASELPRTLIEEKIGKLVDEITTAFGKSPISFRSGRYGFNNVVAETLVKYSFKVDSSITPYLSWQAHSGLPGGDGGPDFTHYTPYPFKIRTGNTFLNEIPITILPTKFPFSNNDRLAAYFFQNRYKNIFYKGINKIYFSKQPLWFRPFPWMTIDLYDELIQTAQNNKLPYLVMMFHSSELMPACSIYRPDEDSVKALLRSLETLFNGLKAAGIESITLSDTIVPQ